MIAAAPGTLDDPGGAYKASAAVAGPGGVRQGAAVVPHASRPEHEQNPESPQGEVEVQRSRENLTSRDLASATRAEPKVHVELTTKDVETLLKLRDAGLIALDGVPVQATSKRLTDWTYEDFERYMVSVQKLRPTKIDGRDSTARCRVRYVRFLETHPAAPVQLRPPDEESWREHVFHRVQEEAATGTTLNQYRKALKSFLKFLGAEPWPSLNDRFEEVPPHWTLPSDEVVPRLWIEPLHPDPYLAATYAHVFHFGVHTGVRPPSEICALNVGDVDFGARRITVTEVKKGGKRRDIDDVEPFILTSPSSKSLWNYATNWRPKVARGDADAFFLDEKGRRFHPNALAAELGRLGRTVWPAFRPYTMRRLFATRFLLDNGFNVYVTAQRLGDTVATVERHYLDKARARSAMRGRFRVRQHRARSGTRED